MARKARTRVSYVLPLPNSPGGHRLGVNSLALDRRGILYTAGRDGAICSWNLHTDLTTPETPQQDDDETSSTMRSKPPASTFRSQVQAHTHWVNDIALTADADALVSCSSDLTVKLWRPSSRDAPMNLGLHSDYVKCVVTPGYDSGTSTDWVASGGLDRKIYLWDINGGGEKLCIDVGDGGSNPKGSIYALGVGGPVLASGGPEGVVRVWDPRSGKAITKFVGHTDLVRSILVSEQGNVILTASSDATVKMWSVTGGRCMHTLTMHNDSVWSLHSDHPSLEVFHSSDRTGLVAKTDIRNVTEIDEGISVAVCQEQEGVNKVISDGGLGSYIWTATSSSRIHRWLDADTNLEIAPRVLLTESSSPPDFQKHQHRPSNASTIGRSIDDVSSPKSSRNTIPINSLLRLSTANPFAPTPTTRDPDAVTVYSMPHNRTTSVSEAILEAEEPGELKPIYEAPDETIEGQNGLIKHVLLNDRRRVLTLDTAGDVVEWDLVKCSVIKTWGKQHLEDVIPLVSTVDSVANWCQVDTRTGRLAVVLEENYCFDAEMYADEVAIDEIIEFKDDQRINLGKWVLRYLFSNLIDEEIRRDEECRKAIMEAKTFRERTRRANAPPTISLPAPPNMKAWDGKLTPLTTPKAGMNGYSGHHYPIQTPGLSIGFATPAIPSFPISSPRADDGSTTALSSHLPAMPEEENGVSTPVEKPDYFSSAPPLAGNQNNELPRSPNPNAVATTASIVPATPVEPPTASKLSFGKLWGKTKGNRNSNVEEKKITEEATPVVPTEAEVKPPEVVDETLTGVLKRIRQDYIPSATNENIKTSICPSLPSDTPVLKHPSDMVVIIQEDKPDSGGVKDVYRGTVGDLGIEADDLEKVVPAWVAEAILLNRLPTKEVVKVSFILLPWHDLLPAIVNVADTNARLNANRMLRTKKIMSYVAERMDPLPEQAGGAGTDIPEAKPEEWLEILCKDEIVPLTTTLATLRAHMWKTGGDVILHYRMKDNAAPVKRKPVVPTAAAAPSTVLNGTFHGAGLIAETRGSSSSRVSEDAKSEGSSGVQVQ